MSLELEILVPDGVVLHTQVRSLQAADATGRFGVLPNHEAFLTLLVPCVLLFQEEDGRERYAAADGGLLTVAHRRAALVTREAVVADDLEQVGDVLAAMLQARQAHEHSARTEFAEMQTALLRELRKGERAR